MADIILYSTLGCHLCETAKEIGDTVFSEVGLSVQEIDIADDPDLMEVYGVRIPVLLRTSDGAELGWPFDESALRRWLRS